MAWEVQLSGSLPAHFQQSYLDARSELIDSVNAYIAAPQWAAVRQELALRGPRLESRRTESTKPSPSPARRWLPSKAEEEEAAAKATAASTAPSIHPDDQTALHLAQVSALSFTPSGLAEAVRNPRCR